MKILDFQKIVSRPFLLEFLISLLESLKFLILFDLIRSMNS